MNWYRLDGRLSYPLKDFLNPDPETKAYLNKFWSDPGAKELLGRELEI